MMWILGALIACGEKEDTASEPASEPATEASAEPSAEPSTEPSGEPGPEPSSEDTAEIEIDCMELDVDACDARPDCVTIVGRSINVDDANDCYTVATETTPVGCMSADMGCTEAITFAQEPEGECTWFSNGCTPAGWESCELPMEECQ